MKNVKYLLDTHVLFNWAERKYLSKSLLSFLDLQSSLSNLFVSSISFWEIALLCKKGKLIIADLDIFAFEFISYSGVSLIEPSYHNMISSTLLDTHHKDPFDRLLISQALFSNLTIITKDKLFSSYDVKVLWK